MLAYGTSSILISSLLNGVYSRDISAFTVTRTGGDNCVTIGTAKVSRTGSYTGTSKTAVLTITPNGNYTSTHTVNVTIAIWQEGSWNLDPASYNSAPNTTATVSITGYNSSLTYTITPGSLTITRSGATLTVTTPAAASTYTATISTNDYEYSTNFTHYAALSHTLTVNSKNIVTSPTWKSNNPEWTGSAIDVSGSTYWNDWNNNLDYSGISAAEVGSHTATFAVPIGEDYWLDTIGTTSV